jgi:hypothetical protein
VLCCVFLTLCVCVCVCVLFVFSLSLYKKGQMDEYRRALDEAAASPGAILPDDPKETLDFFYLFNNFSDRAKLRREFVAVFDGIVCFFFFPPSFANKRMMQKKNPQNRCKGGVRKALCEVPQAHAAAREGALEELDWKSESGSEKQTEEEEEASSQEEHQHDSGAAKAHPG